MREPTVFLRSGFAAAGSPRQAEASKAAGR